MSITIHLDLSAGNGFAINRHGFVFTYNGLYPKLPLMENCLPRQVHNRLVLTVENEKQLERMMKTTVSAYGFNMNVGRFRSSDGPLIDYLTSYEIGPSKDDGRTNDCNINYVLNKEQILGRSHTRSRTSDFSYLVLSRYFPCRLSNQSAQQGYSVRFVRTELLLSLQPLHSLTEHYRRAKATAIK
jgi:hypothetical protein